MRRRQLLTGGAVGLSAILAGCAGYEVLTTEQLRQKEARIHSLENTIDDLRSDKAQLRQQLSDLEERINRLQTRISDLQAKQSSLETKVESLEDANQQLKSRLESVRSDLQRAQARQILLLYRAGEANHDLAAPRYRSGQTAIDETRWADALREMAVAAGGFSAARVDFADAKGRARERGLSDVASTCYDAEQRCKFMSEAATGKATGAELMLEGKTEEASTALSDAQKPYRNAQFYDVKSVSTVAESLGVTL
ncbi:MAG: hypothetical protein ABEI31_09720 [Halodesulfurarchaeum sp.]